MDWGHEWLTSLRWTATVSTYTLVGFVLVALLLMRSTRWGRQFRAITLPYFVPGRTPRSWLPLITVAALIFLNVLDVRVAVVLSDGQNDLNTAVQELHAPAFYHSVIALIVIMVMYTLESLCAFAVQQALTINWRVWLNDRTLTDWLAGRAYYRSQFTATPVGNPDQRIQEDVESLPSDSAKLAFGAVNALISLFSFIVILWDLSGPLSLMGVTLPRAATFIILAYVAVSSALAFRIGKPLIGLYFSQEGRNASFRYALVRLRDNAESIAFYQGDDSERRSLDHRFRRVIRNSWAIVFRSLKLQCVNLTFTQVSGVFPLIIQAPRLFAGTIKLGDVVQTASAMAQVHDALSFFRTSYDDFAQYRAVVNRLSGLLEANAQARELPVPSVTGRSEGLSVEHLTVDLPAGRRLVTDLRLELRNGDSLLVTGPSGAGKTTLLRSLAGLWPYAEGSVARPTGEQALFLAQRPYLPLGGLRTALAYPGPADRLDDRRAGEVLRQVQLPHLLDRLDEQYDWSRTLSPGEQQRIGFARLLLARPAVAFLDESSAALDEGLEQTLYQLLRERLPDCVLVSVAHRATLERLHTHRLELRAGGDWSFSSLLPESV